MVSYQAWVSICFETLQDRGVKIDDIDDGGSVMQFAADVWRRNGDRIKRMSTEAARDAALRAAEAY